MTKSKVFFILSLSFIGGVAAASFLHPKTIEKYFLVLGLVFGVVFLVLFYGNKKATAGAFAFAFFIFGFFLVEERLEKLKNPDSDGKNFSGEAMIVKEPDQKEKYQKLIVRAENIPDAKILVNVYDKTDYYYGDKINLECGALKTPENFSSDFDYRMYLAKDGIFYECQKPRIDPSAGGIGENQGNGVYKFVLGVKNKFNEKIEKNIPAPESGLLSGLLLGGDSLISKSWREKFSATGMSHIVAVSGYNVTIIAEYLMTLGIFLGLWRRQAFWLSIFGIGIFVFMIGLPSSAVRAGVMGGLLLWAMKNGRLGNSQNAILASGCVMLAINPLLLRWDIGFQLSFLATLGIIYVYPIFQNYLANRDALQGRLYGTAAEILFLTLAAQIFVLPVILFNFGNLSLVSPLANLLVLPVIPLAMLLGFLAAIFSFMIPPLGIVFSWLAYLPLKYETLIIDYLAGLKYASVELRLPWWGAAVWYAMLFSAVYFFKKRQENIEVES